VGLSGEHRVCRFLAFRVSIFAPGFVEAKVGVVLCLAGYRVAVGEDELEAGRFEVIVAAGGVKPYSMPSSVCRRPWGWLCL
jgi:hypothetical protein